MIANVLIKEYENSSNIVEFSVVRNGKFDLILKKVRDYID